MRGRESEREGECVFSSLLRGREMLVIDEGLSSRLLEAVTEHWKE